MSLRGSYSFKTLILQHVTKYFITSHTNTQAQTHCNCGNVTHEWNRQTLFSYGWKNIKAAPFLDLKINYYHSNLPICVGGTRTNNEYVPNFKFLSSMALQVHLFQFYCIWYIPSSSLKRRQKSGQLQSENPIFICRAVLHYVKFFILEN